MTSPAPRPIWREPWLCGVLVVGLLARLALIPITHGQDFVVWDLATKATLHDINIYAHHPSYPGGPYAYFPLFLYIETPFQWVAEHTPFSFLVLGKLPILAADVACALLIAAELRDRQRSPRSIALWTAAFFLNPLVLYNSAYYGRFDTLGCALTLAALRFLRRRPAAARGAVTFGLAIAAKTFPVVLLPGVLKQSRRWARRNLAIAISVLVYLSIPYLDTLKPFLHDLFVYDAQKQPQGLAWQYVLPDVASMHATKVIGYVMLGLFTVAAVWLVRIPDMWRYVAATLVAFLVCAKVVLEQYLIWPMPWLLLLAATATVAVARASGALVVLFTVVGTFDNELFHPLGRSNDAINVTIACCCVAFLVVAAQPRLSVPKVSQALGSPV